MPLVYREIRAIAERAMRREAPDHTLQATALAHEAYLRLVDQIDVDWKGRSHVLGIAAQAVRRILVDHARKGAADKRGGGRVRIGLSSAASARDRGDDVDLIALDEALQVLADRSERQARIVELRFFGGLTFKEIAQELGISERTAKNDWRFARAWLRGRLAS